MNFLKKFLFDYFFLLCYNKMYTLIYKGIHMAEYQSNNNKKGKGHNGRSPLTVAVSVVVAAVVVIAVFLLTKNTVFCSIARSQAEKGNFAAAEVVINRASGENARALAEYIDLRAEINESYPTLLTKFDSAKIEKWAYTSAELCEKSDALGEELAADNSALSQILSQISSCDKEYNAMKKDILEMMNVFNEINRLHTKDAEGKNISFTISDERQRTEAWTQLNNKILAFISQVPGNEKIYLFNYMAKEAQGEISEINSAIDSVAQSGYGENELVRFSGDAEKKFPDITNSNGDTVNLLDKEIYEKYMYAEFCNKLVQNLAPYYNN